MTFFFEQAMADSADLQTSPPINLFIRNSGYQLIAPAEIVSLQAEKNYSWVLLQNGQRLLTTKTIKQHCALLPETWFVRIHRSIVVNRRFIQQIDYVGNSYEVTLRNGQQLAISRRQWAQIRLQLLGDQAQKSRSIKASFR
ncbi:LytTR family DNA-binding domain-containing protein [Spirosoma sp. SC4-14]|uniref:LytR/AlgR family response regulator transcription factor n=1 Tax=Spirosoma sp. SC4-14 TaxID=3128900 RepID=UPI0030D0BE4B